MRCIPRAACGASRVPVFPRLRKTALAASSASPCSRDRARFGVHVNAAKSCSRRRQRLQAPRLPSTVGAGFQHRQLSTEHRLVRSARAAARTAVCVPRALMQAQELHGTRSRVLRVRPATGVAITAGGSSLARARFSRKRSALCPGCQRRERMRCLPSRQRATPTAQAATAVARCRRRGKMPPAWHAGSVVQPGLRGLMAPGRVLRTTLHQLTKKSNSTIRIIMSSWIQERDEVRWTAILAETEVFYPGRPRAGTINAGSGEPMDCTGLRRWIGDFRLRHRSHRRMTRRCNRHRPAPKAAARTGSEPSTGLLNPARLSSFPAGENLSRRHPPTVRSRRTSHPRPRSYGYPTGCRGNASSACTDGMSGFLLQGQRFIASSSWLTQRHQILPVHSPTTGWSARRRASGTCWA